MLGPHRPANRTRTAAADDDDDDDVDNDGVLYFLISQRILFLYKQLECAK